MKTRGPRAQGPMAFMRIRSPEQRAAALAPRRVDADHRDAQRVVLVEAQAADQLVGQARLAGAAGAGDAQHRHPPAPRPGVQRHHQPRVGLAVLEGGDEPRQRAPGRVAVAADRLERPGRVHRGSTSQRRTISPIMPCRPMRCPSSGL